jgi:parallel beta-helix repeat protein
MKKASMKGGIVILASLTLAVVSQAEIIIVDDDGPADFNNIQAAIDDSNDGDIIFVFPGTYTGPGNRDIDYDGRAVTVRSVAPEDPYFVAATVIDCEGVGRGFNFNSGEDANSVLNGLTITNGYADYGGAIRCGWSPTILNCILMNNTATSDGGAIYGWRRATIISCTVVNNTAINGGGINSAGGDLRILNCTITQNYASEYGGGIHDLEARTIITDSNITENEAGVSGGGICGSRSNMTITHSAITNNSTDGSGGGVCFWGHYWEPSASAPTVANCLITGNSAVWNGGGACWGNYGKPTVAGCTFSGNTTDKNGGGLAGFEDVANCTIIGNTAVKSGGGMYACNGVTDCVVSGNSAGDSGGGMYECSAAENCVISGNVAANYGGGLCDCSTPLSCLIVGNVAGLDGGGVHQGTGLSNCTVASNLAHAGCGGGVFLDYGELLNCIVWGNSDAGSDPVAAQVCGPSGEVSFSCIQDDDPNDANIPFGGADNNNIDDYPLFLRDPNDGGDGWGDDPCTGGVNEGENDDYGDLHLRFGSPCINAGNSLAVMPDSLDIDGQPRVMAAVVDMGADELLIPTIIVTKPEGGEVWTSGSWHQINWQSLGYEGTVDIQFRPNTGDAWQVIESAAENTGSYTWQLPDVDSNQCEVRVGTYVPNPKMAIGSGLFTIQPDSSGPEVASTWKSLGGDFDRVGRSDYRGPQLGCVKWEFEVDGAISASVTVGPNETVYVPCEDGNLYTLDVNGSVLWTYEANSPLISAATLGLDGTAYVGSKDGKLYAIDINGNLRWTHATDGMVYSSPAVSADGNNVYVCSEDGKLYALGRDGSELWSFETAGFGVVGGAILASPTVAEDGTVYIGGLYDSNLYALDPNDGNTNWVCHFDSDGWLFASPVIAPDGTIYQTLLYDPNLYAVDPNDGNVMWSTHLAEVEYGDQYSLSYWFEPAYPGSASGFDTRDCQAYYSGGGWNVSDSGWSEPVVGRDGRIYVSFDDPWLRVVEPNGVIERILKAGSQSGFSLTAGRDGNIYAASNDSNLYALNPGGFEIARFDSDDYWLNFPVLSTDNTLIISDSRNNSLLISYENNKVQAISSDGCGGQELDLYWQGGPQDLNDDGFVDYLDVAVVAEDWLKCRVCSRYDPDYRLCARSMDYYDTTFAPGDVNRDRYVNFADIALIAERWSAGY